MGSGKSLLPPWTRAIPMPSLLKMLLSRIEFPVAELATWTPSPSLCEITLGANAGEGAGDRRGSSRRRPGCPMPHQ